MPSVPQGHKRPAEVISCADHIAEIATGEIEETKLRHPVKREEIAHKTATARWQ
jgi:hypothetical protein